MLDKSIKEGKNQMVNFCPGMEKFLLGCIRQQYHTTAPANFRYNRFILLTFIILEHLGAGRKCAIRGRMENMTDENVLRKENFLYSTTPTGVRLRQLWWVGDESN